MDVGPTPPAPVAARHGRGVAPSVAGRAAKILGTRRRKEPVGPDVSGEGPPSSREGTESLPSTSRLVTGVVERPAPPSARRPRAAFRIRAGGPVDAGQTVDAGSAGVAPGVRVCASASPVRTHHPSPQPLAARAAQPLLTNERHRLGPRAPLTVAAGVAVPVA